jgi:hypothetical protein
MHHLNYFEGKIIALRFIDDAFESNFAHLWSYQSAQNEPKILLTYILYIFQFVYSLFTVVIAVYIIVLGPIIPYCGKQSWHLVQLLHSCS